MTQAVCTNEGRDYFTYADDQPVWTTRGTVQADQLQAATPAEASIAGEDDVDGDVDYQAAGGGSWGNQVSVAQVVGATGLAEADRDLAVTVTADLVTVVFGTDGGGASVTPTASEVEAVVNAVPQDQARVRATAGGTGASSAGVSAPVQLDGGLDDGDHIYAGQFPIQVCKREAA